MTFIILIRRDDVLSNYSMIVMPDLIGYLFFVMPDVTLGYDRGLIGHLYNHRIHHHPFI